MARQTTQGILQLSTNQSAVISHPLIITLLVLLLLPYQAAWSKWQPVSQGIDYQDLNPSALKPWSHIHVFRINLNKYQLVMGLAKQLGLNKTSSIAQIAHKSEAVIALNGGFFSKSYQPLGLRMQSGKILNPLKNISWWGILYTQNNRAKLVSKNQFRANPKIDFAIQSGPRLIVNGKIPKLKTGIAERSALGITRNGDIILLATERHPLSTTQLARLMRSYPISCQYALNLDGGSSTQLVANLPNFKLSVNGFSNITDAIIVKAK